MNVSKPSPTRPAILTARPPVRGLTLLLRGRRGCRPPYYIFGGYGSVPAPAGVNNDDIEEEPKFYLLIRRKAVTTPYRDDIVRLETRNRYRVLELTEEEMIPSKDWDIFLDLPEGCAFRRAERSWRKLRPIEIEALVRDRTFIHAALLNRGR